MKIRDHLWCAGAHADAGVLAGSHAQPLCFACPALGTCQPGEPWLHPLGPPQAPEREEQEQQAEVPEPTPTSEGTSRDVTTVTLLLRVPPGDTPSPPASPDSSPTTTSPEPPLEPAEAQCPVAEALDSPEPPSSPPRATSSEPQEPPAAPSTEGQVVNKVSLAEGQGCQTGEPLGLGIRPCPCHVSPAAPAWPHRAPCCPRPHQRSLRHKESR